MSRSVRGAGAGRDRPGATDTTMLIWKLIETEPGITRDQILAKIGARVPLGYARRRLAAHMASRNAPTVRGGQAAVAAPSLNGISADRARRFLVTNSLKGMRASGTVARDGEGAYRVLRPLRYYGDPETIDITGTKAAEHLDRAYAIRTLRKFNARAEAKGSQFPTMTREEYVAFKRVFWQLLATQEVSHGTV